jgi:iron(III) transport system substrate-binding protein
MLKRLVAAAMLVVLAACAQTEDPQAADPTDAAAEGDGALTVYSGRSEELVGPVIEKFEKESGIDVDVRYGETAELAAQILEEGENSPADLFWAQDAGALGAVAKDDRFAELDDAILDRVPEGFRSPDGLWVGTSGRARVLAYNTEAVEESDLPDSVLDLTDEQWKGRIGWAPTNGSFQAFVTALREIEGEDAASEWLEAMVENDTQDYDGNSAIVQAVVDGEIDAGLVNHYYILEMGSEDAEVKEKAANHFFADGDVGSVVNAAGVGILEGAENADNAEAFTEFLLSRSGAEYFDEEIYEYPLVEGRDTPEGLPNLEDIDQPDVDLSDLDDLEGTLDLMRKAGVL